MCFFRRKNSDNNWHFCAKKRTRKLLGSSLSQVHIRLYFFLWRHRKAFSLSLRQILKKKAYQQELDRFSCKSVLTVSVSQFCLCCWKKFDSLPQERMQKSFSCDLGLKCNTTNTANKSQLCFHFSSHPVMSECTMQWTSEKMKASQEMKRRKGLRSAMSNLKNEKGLTWNIQFDDEGEKKGRQILRENTYKNKTLFLYVRWLLIFFVWNG